MKLYIGFCPLRVDSWRRRFLRPTVFTLCVLALALVHGRAQTITTAVPGFFNFQGKVVAANGSPLGASPNPVNRLVTFRIWDHGTSAASGNLIYSEQQTVTITDGEFSVLIGQGAAVSGIPLGYSETAKGPGSITIADASVFGGATRFLGITVDDGTTNADPEISPRQQLVTTAYAFRAKYAESVGANGVSTLTTLDNGNVGIGTTTPARALDVNAAAVRFANGGNGFEFAQASATNWVFANLGTANTVGFNQLSVGSTYGGTAAPANGVIVQGNVGVGVTTPGAAGGPWAKARFAVDGNIALRGEGGGNDWTNQRLLFGGDGSGYTMSIASVSNVGTVNPAIMTLSDSSNVGIGATNPTAKLHISGSEATSNGLGLQITNSASGGSNWHMRVGATGTTTPAGALSFGNDTAYRMTITSGGNVGIGTTTPAHSLHILASTPEIQVGNSGGTGGALYFGNSNHGVKRGFNNFSNDVGLWTSGGSVNLSAVGPSNSSQFILRDNGRVGIGTDNPGMNLDVIGGVRASGGSGYTFGGGGDTDGGLFSPADGTITIWTNNAERVRVNSSGRVGILTNNPQAPLHVAGWNDINFFNDAFGHSGGFGDWGAQETKSLSAIFEVGVRASNFYINSDARLKVALEKSDGASDLATLQKIEVTNYGYRDRITHGAGRQKKVIAQQVEEVFAQAVSKSTGVIPDIFQRAESRDGWLIVETDLKAGERVQLIADGKAEVSEVLEAEPGRFRTAFKPTTDKVFVYGREVSDFRTVDYDAIAMLNVSATQELSRKVTALQTANAALTARLADFEAKDRARDAKLASIEKLLSSGQTVMARPAATTTSNASGQE